METLRSLLRERRAEFFVIAALLWLLPGLALLLLGLFYLWQAGWFWWFSGALLLLALLSWGARRLLARTEPAVEEAGEDVQHLQPQAEWSRHDKAVWHECVAHIEEAQLAACPWEAVPRAMLDHLTYVAKAYHGEGRDAEYAFTIPELLLMLETWSREYRAEVMEHMPLAQDVKISTLKSLSRGSGRALRYYGYVSPFVRALRVGINPVTGIAGELSSHLASKYMSDFSQHVQGNMKIVLFEQVTQVGIDLYSGRLKFSEEELAARRQQQDAPELVEVRPLSVLLVGQVNAGKSSLVNALKEQIVAGTDALPATDGFHYHALQLGEELELHLIDTPGLDGSEETMQALLEQAVQADLLIWVSQATQPAKALDKQFYERWSGWFEAHLSRKKPPVLLVTTHNDSLPPAGSWHPPYDLSDPADKKVQNMLAALQYTQESIGLAESTQGVPLSLLPGAAASNVDVLLALLLALSDEARAAQLNRERLDADAGSSLVARVLQQSSGLVKVGVKLALK